MIKSKIFWVSFVFCFFAYNVALEGAEHDRAPKKEPQYLTVENEEIYKSTTEEKDKGAQQMIKEPVAPPLVVHELVQTLHEEKEEKSVALSGDDERLRPKEQFQIPIGDSLLSISGELSFEADSKINRNLDSTKNRDKVELVPEFELDFLLAFPQGFILFAEVSLEDEVTLENGEKAVNEFEDQPQLEEAFAQIPRFLFPENILRLGRQQFFESRRWLFDDRLDSIRFLIDLSPISFDFSLSTEWDFISYASYQIAEKASISGYVIVRNQEPFGDEDQIWVGFRSIGTVKKKNTNIKYWAEGAYVDGKTLQKKGAQDINGFAIDLGGTFIFRKQPLKPGFTFGYAFGSGDNNPGDGVDHNFRQTGLQSNKSKFGGVSNFEYYGVALDPELSNLHIITAGFGVRPFIKASVDLVYHYYLQHKPSIMIRDFGIRANPTGLDRNLGQEIDLIVGYKGIKNTKLRFKSGYFIPNRGFVENDNAFRCKFDIKFAF